MWVWQKIFGKKKREGVIEARVDFKRIEKKLESVSTYEGPGGPVWGSGTRYEQLKFKLTFPAEMKELLAEILAKFSTIKQQEYDARIDLTYTLNLSYFECADKLEAIIAMLEWKQLVSVDLKELEYGRCLIEELFLKIRKIQEKLNANRLE